MPARYSEIVRELKKAANPKKAVLLQGYFKTGKGQYGEGDRFLGITVPPQRQIARQFRDLPLTDLAKLLASNIHEHRFTALEILVMQYEQGSPKEQEQIVKFYLRQTKWINNWDLVDTSAPYILGHFLFKRDRGVLYKLVRSKNLWERRIAIVATYYFIDQDDFADTLKLSKLLLIDKHDLIHKATGWMLREMGKRSESTLIGFLDEYAHLMPRTMLRYAIERLAPAFRAQYLAKKGLD